MMQQLVCVPHGLVRIVCYARKYIGKERLTVRFYGAIILVRGHRLTYPVIIPAGTRNLIWVHRYYLVIDTS